MADKKISELPAVAALDTDDLLAVVEDGTTKKATVQDILDLAPSGNGIPTVINAVTDYSAAGDGVTNDLTAIENAMSAANGAGGGIVYLPEGDYLIGTTGSTADVLEVPSNVTLRGAGRDVSILRSASTQTGVRPFSFVDGATYSRIEQLSLVANTPTDHSIGIQFKANEHCVVDDCYISADFGWGVQLAAGCYYNVLSNTEIAGTTTANGFENDGGSYNTVVGCHIHDSDLQLIENGDVSDVGWGAVQDPTGFCVGNQFLNNFLIDAGGGAINTMGDKGTVISGNVIVGAGIHGIFATAAEWPLDDSIVAVDLTITGNTIRECTDSGITLGAATRACTITGNTVEGTAGTGIGISSACTSATITGNICRLNGGHGMMVTGDRSIVIGNVCLNNSGAGVSSWHGLSVDTADYAKVIGNVCSDDRGGSNRQAIGTIVSGGTTGVVLIGNGGAGNTTLTTYDSGTSTYRLGNEGVADSTGGTTLGVGGPYVGSAGESLSVTAADGSVALGIYDTALDLHYFQYSHGGSILQPELATGGVQTQDSPFVVVRSARWNGSASAFEAWTNKATRLSASQYGNNLQWLNSNDAVTFALGDGAEGSATVGTTTVGPSTLASLGKFHVQPGADTTVGQSVKAFSSGATADLQRFYNANGDVLIAVSAAGNLVLTDTTVRIKFGHSGHAQTTVGAAGGATALPATPTKYFKVLDSSGTTLVIPAYAAS